MHMTKSDVTFQEHGGAWLSLPKGKAEKDSGPFVFMFYTARAPPKLWHPHGFPLLSIGLETHKSLSVGSQLDSYN